MKDNKKESSIWTNSANFLLLVCIFSILLVFISLLTSHQGIALKMLNLIFFTFSLVVIVYIFGIRYEKKN